MGFTEWTIIHRYDNLNYVFGVYDTGRITSADRGDVVYDFFGVRPSFYLNNSVIYSGGSGTSQDPILKN